MSAWEASSARIKVGVHFATQVYTQHIKFILASSTINRKKNLQQLKGWEHNCLTSNFGLFLFFAQICLIFGM